MMKELSELRDEITAFLRERKDAEEKRRDGALLMDRMEESLRQTYASLKRAQKVAFEAAMQSPGSRAYHTTSAGDGEYTELNERLVLKLAKKIELMLLSYLQYSRKERDILKPTIEIEESIRERIAKLKKKQASRLFDAKALDDPKLVELLLMVERFETVAQQIVSLYCMMITPCIGSRGGRTSSRTTTIWAAW